MAAVILIATGIFADTEPGGASPRLLTPQNSALILIDHQPQMAFATRALDGQTLVNNVTGLAKSANSYFTADRCSVQALETLFAVAGNAPQYGIVFQQPTEITGSQDLKACIKLLYQPESWGLSEMNLLTFFILRLFSPWASLMCAIISTCASEHNGQA